MVDIFATLVQNLNAWGFYGFVLPFLFMFALVYGLLMKSKILGDQKGPIGVVSLALAFFVTAYSGIGQYFIGLSGIGAMLLGALLVVILFFAMMNFEGLDKVTSNIWLVAILGVLAIIVFFILGGASIANVPLTNDTVAIAFMLIVIGLEMYFVTYEKKA